MSGKIRLLGVLLVLATVLGGCAYAVSPVTGMLYTDVQGPVIATDLANSSRIGTATCYSLLGLVGVGDASIQAAARNGNITRIHHVDHESQVILGLYAKFTTIVYGE